MSTNTTLDSFGVGYEKLQTRFDNRVVIANATKDQNSGFLDAGSITNKEIFAGFVDISMPVKDIGTLKGRVLLTTDKEAKAFYPVVITQKAGVMQISKLEQQYDPKTGITDGIMFGLGLKNDTASSNFGSHISAGGYEAGHFAPVLIGANNNLVGQSIKQDGDKATHSVGSKSGGVAEQMINDGLMTGFKLTTRNLDVNNPNPIPLFWHKSLESNDGLLVAEYKDSVKLMLGAATNSLGSLALDKVGSLVEDSVRGSH